MANDPAQQPKQGQYLPTYSGGWGGNLDPSRLGPPNSVLGNAARVAMEGPKGGSELGRAIFNLGTTYGELVLDRKIRDEDTAIQTLLRDRRTHILQDAQKQGAAAEGLLNNEFEWVQKVKSEFARTSDLNNARVEALWAKHGEKHINWAADQMLKQELAAQEESRYRAAQNIYDNLADAPPDTRNLVQSWLDIDALYPHDPDKAAKAKAHAVNILLGNLGNRSPELLSALGASSEVDSLAKQITSHGVATEDINALKGTSQFVPPVGGYRVSSNFGDQESFRKGPHKGMDIACPKGTQLGAIADGVVTFVGAKGGFGNQVVIDHGGGITTALSHLDSSSVAVGQVVKQGDVVALSGNTGFSTGPHVDVRAYNGKTAIDPRLLFNGSVKLGADGKSSIAVQGGGELGLALRIGIGQQAVKELTQQRAEQAAQQRAAKVQQAGAIGQVSEWVNEQLNTPGGQVITRDALLAKSKEAGVSAENAGKLIEQTMIRQTRAMKERTAATTAALMSKLYTDGLGPEDLATAQQAFEAGDISYADFGKVQRAISQLAKAEKDGLKEPYKLAMDAVKSSMKNKYGLDIPQGKYFTDLVQQQVASAYMNTPLEKRAAFLNLADQQSGVNQIIQEYMSFAQGMRYSTTLTEINEFAKGAQQRLGGNRPPIEEAIRSLSWQSK